ncbi:MAG: SRPBCC family protein [Microthrixaceae bacterium]|nr:SRPBCC family protein [Microthrixaceae bacterium]MCB9386860.1 SRPBCC family protein [Microthrixaceae bacterium]
MPSFSDVMHIESTPATVFDLLADPRHEVDWNEGVSRAELLTDEPIGQGSKFVVEDKRGEHEVVITVFDRPDRVGFALTGKQMDVAIEYGFTESDGTTTAAGRFDARPKGLMKVLLPLLLPIIKRDIAKQHVNFKKLCETQMR